MMGHVITLEWVYNGTTDRWSLTATNSTGGDIHDFGLATAGRFFSYPPAWSDGVTRTFYVWFVGQPHPDTSASHMTWYADGDVNNETLIEQILP